MRIQVHGCQSVGMGLIMAVFFVLPLSSSLARDFENNYAVYGAGAESCSKYLQSMVKGGKEQDYFIEWTIGYLSAFNVIMPNTYHILGESDFSTAQGWLERHCKRYPNDPYVNAVIKLTGVLYPLRFQSSLKKPPAKKAKR